MQFEQGDFSFMISAADLSINPKKRIFLALVLFSAMVTALILFFTWKVTYLGFESISRILPAAFGVLISGAVFFLFAGELAIVLAILGMPLPKILYFWSWKAINFLFPFAVGLGRILNIPRGKVEQSFVAVNNALVRQHHVRVPSDRLLILTPHCLQLDTCPRKITRDIENCAQCGACSVAIIAVACERDLTSGIQDVFPIPVIAIFNERPFGPCFNTRVDINRVEEAIKMLSEDLPADDGEEGKNK